MTRLKALAIFNALTFITHVAFAYLTQTTSINDKNVGDVSAQYESLFTPAGMTFSIWGIIYTLLAMFCLYHIIIAFKHDKNNAANYELSKIGGWFILVSLASAAWLFAWVNEKLPLSVALILIQLIGLLVIHYRLHMYDTNKTAGVKICTQFPLSVYLGWISIATIANISSYLASIQWNGWGLGQIEWTLVMISIAILLSVFMILGKKNFYFGLVVAWGLYGIISKRKAIDSEVYEQIIMAAWIGIIIIGICTLIQIVRNISYKEPTPIFPVSAAPLK